MQDTVVARVAMWSAWQPEREMFFNSFLLTQDGGNVAVDPLEPDDATLAAIERAGGIAWIVVTNRDHERGARDLARRFGAKIVASELDAPLLSGPVDRTVRDGDDVGGARVVALDGHKTHGEFALHLADRKTIVVGDAIWGKPVGALTMMPDDKLADPARAALSLRKLAALRPDSLLLGDGACIFGCATAALWAMLEARPDVYVNKFGRDEFVWRDWPGEPEPYAGGQTAEIGDYIGAEKLGYRLLRLPPGTASCPMHWHLAEEELFVVTRGAVRLEHRGGQLALREGDYVCFPTRSQGAHKLVNDSSEPCEVLMVANTDAHDVCWYPHSRKVLIEATGTMLRDHPELEYFDGE